MVVAVSWDICPQKRVVVAAGHRGRWLWPCGSVSHGDAAGAVPGPACTRTFSAADAAVSAFAAALLEGPKS